MALLAGSANGVEWHGPKKTQVNAHIPVTSDQIKQASYCLRTISQTPSARCQTTLSRYLWTKDAFARSRLGIKNHTNRISRTPGREDDSQVTDGVLCNHTYLQRQTLRGVLKCGKLTRTGNDMGPIPSSFAGRSLPVAK